MTNAGDDTPTTTTASRAPGLTIKYEFIESGYRELARLQDIAVLTQAVPRVGDQLVAHKQTWTVKAVFFSAVEPDYVVVKVK